MNKTISLQTLSIALQAYRPLKKIRSKNITTLQQQHTDIPSFLRYASLSSLNPATTVFTGTLYEYTVLAALSRCLPGISLTRVGGRDDAGVDLSGTWELPRIPRQSAQIEFETEITKSQKGKGKVKGEEEEEEEHEQNELHTLLPLTIQCKNVQQKGWKGPQYIRELEGALASHPLHALGILASVRDMTPGMKKQMLSSRRALGFVKVTPLEGVYHDNDDDEKISGQRGYRLTGKGGLLQQFAWNEVANRYIGGFGIGARYVKRSHAIMGVELGEFLGHTANNETRNGKDVEGEEGKEEEPLEQEITLTWNGSPISRS